MRQLDRTTAQALQELYVEAQERCPGVLVAFDAFCDRALAALGPARADADTLRRHPTADLYLAVALEQGAPQALALFHREYFDFVRSISRKYARNIEDAEDIAQDLCATIPTRIGKYQGTGSLKGWIGRIVPNVTRDLYRSGAEAWERSLDALSDANPDMAPMPEMPLLSDDGRGADDIREAMDRSRCQEMFQKTLASAFEHLDPEQRELVTYRYIEGLSGREIARIRGVAEYVISKHLKKALNRLEKRILMAATTLFAFSSREVRDCLGLLD